jgi:pentatricopeptide repeat protein
LEAAAALMDAAVGKGLLEGSRELWEARVRLVAATASTTSEEEEEGVPQALEALLREMDAAGFPPSIPLVADLLMSFTRHGHPARATALFSSLRWHQQQQKQKQQPQGEAALARLLPPPTRALHQAMLLSFCATEGRWPVALALLRKMQSRASPHLAPWQLEATAPTRPCYTAVIEGAIRGQDMAAALGVLRTMEARGMLPSQRCLVRLIQGFAAAKDVGGALGVWRELRLLYPQGQTSKGAFEAILSACVRDPMGVEAALGILQDMARSGWSLDRQYYLPMMVRVLG